MTNNIQKKLEMIGKYGCYFLCLLKATGYNEDDIVHFYDVFLNKGYIDEECTILKPSDILYDLTGRNFKCVKTTELPKKYEFAVEYWYNERTKLHHFKLSNWDSIENSVTVREGKIESYRVYSLI